LSDCGAPYQASEWNWRSYIWQTGGILKHPIQGITSDRREDFNVITSAYHLAVAIDRRGVRLSICHSQQDFEKLWRGSVVVLPVTKKLFQIPLQKPVEITDPVQSLRMHDHAKSWIGQKRATSFSRFPIITVNRDDSFEVAERLLLQAIESLNDEIGAPVDWQSHSDARCRQVALSFSVPT
jgi:hypothetical protein